MTQDVHSSPATDSTPSSRARPRKPPLLLALVRLPLDIICLTLDVLHVTWWLVSQFPQLLIGNRWQSFPPMTSSGTRHVGGHAVRQCRLANKYGSLFLIRFLFPKVYRLVDDSGETFFSWGKVRSRRPITVTRYILSLAFVIGFWTLAGLLGVALFPRPHAEAVAGGERPALSPLPPASPSAGEPSVAGDIIAAAQEKLAGGALVEARELFFNAARVDPGNVEAHLGLAETATLLKATDAARSAYRDALQRAPDNPTALFGMARIHRRDGAAKEGTATLRKLLGLAPEHLDARLLLSQWLNEEGMSQEAREHAALAVNQAPENWDAHLALANAERLLGHAETAETHYRKAIDIAPERIEARIGLARTFSQAGNLREAEALLSALVREAPDNLEAAADLIDLYVGAGQLYRALALAQTVTSQHPTALGLRRRLGGLLLNTRRYNDLYKEATGVLTLDPGNTSAHLQLALLYMQKELPALSIEHCRRALAQNANLREARRLLAAAHLADGSPEKARSDLELLLKNNPDDLDSALKLVRCHQLEGQHERALAAARAAAERHPELIEPLVHITQLYYMQEKMQEALGYARKAHEMAPNNTLAMNNLAALIAANQGDLQEALALAENAHRQEPGSPVVSETLGWLYVLADRAQEALPLLTYALQQSPTSPESRYHYAQALHALGRTAEARAQLETALLLAPAFVGRAQAEELLETIRAATAP